MADLAFVLCLSRSQCEFSHLPVVSRLTLPQLFERKLCFLSSVGDTNNKQVCQVPMPDAYSNIFSSEQSASGLRSTEDWINDLFPTFDGPMPDTRVSDWTYAGDPTLSPMSQPPKSAQSGVAQAPKGPFDPRYSLDRCVYASKRLLELSRGDALKVNPFPACSHVLIAFTLLMQALSLSNGLSDDDGAGDEIPNFSRELLQSAQGSAALLDAKKIASEGSRQQRLTQLREIWENVKEARDTLEELSKYWDM